MSVRLLLLPIVVAIAGCAARPTVVPVPPSTVSSNPTIVRSVVGKSVSGAPIDTVTFTFPRSASTDVVFIFAGIHGDEVSTPVVADRFIELLSDPDVDSRDFPLRLVVIARASPDGVAAKTRVNSRGVDLNRNFPASNWRESKRDRNWNGPAPLSEPESRALHDLVLTLNPARIVSIHSIRPPRHGNNFDGPARSLAELMSRHNGYAVLPTMGYPTPGSFGSWAGIDRQIPVITLELPSNVTGDEAWRVNREALLAFIRGK
jgi:murein peptide amidase A